MRITDILNESDFRKQIKSAPASGYLFFGEEDYLKSFSLKTARDTVCPDSSLLPFNDIKLDGLNLTPDALLGAITTLPMMCERKLVEVTGVNFKEMKSSLLDEYCKVLALLEEYDYNTVIINVSAGGIDEGFLPKKPSPAIKKLGESLVPVWFEQSKPVMLARWASKHFVANGVRADAAVCSALVEYCGTDMFRLASETEKISWYVLSCGRDIVDPEDIYTAAVADTGFDSFAFTNAIMGNKKSEALSILSEMRRRRTEPTIIMGEVTRVVCDMLSAKLMADEGMSPQEIATKLKIHEYRVKLCLRSGAGRERLTAVLALCADADAALKLSPQGYSALERLICSM